MAYEDAIQFLTESPFRTNSEFAYIYFKVQEPLRTAILHRTQFLIRFWMTYSHTQKTYIEKAETIFTIMELCVHGKRSSEVAKIIEETYLIVIPEEFIDRIFLRVTKLLRFLLLKEFPDLSRSLNIESESSEQMEKVYTIFKEFSDLPHRINNYIFHSETFEELARYNPHYIDFLQYFHSGKKVVDIILESGVQLSKSSQFSVSEAMISALVRGKFTKANYSIVEAHVVGYFTETFKQDPKTIKALTHTFLFYLDATYTEVPYATERRKFLELVLIFHKANIFDQRYFLDNDFRKEELEKLLESIHNRKTLPRSLEYILRKFLEPGGTQEILSRLIDVGFTYSERYLQMIITAGVQMVVGAVLMGIYSEEDINRENIIGWQERNRTEDCKTILRLLSHQES